MPYPVTRIHTMIKRALLTCLEKWSDGTFTAYVPGLQEYGAVFRAGSEQEAVAGLQSALYGVIAEMKEKNIPFPKGSLINQQLTENVDGLAADKAPQLYQNLKKWERESAVGRKQPLRVNLVQLTEWKRLSGEG